ncbi:MAG: MerR family transcriptional regulator [Leifsonia xyli]|nr:MAG: MerR family transcriptional regulator [Leifsonia xyli]
MKREGLWRSMRSGELARLAGVTVRTLRHYHRLGVLGEPERLSNGYREYDVHHLIRVLRIRRLASLGIALDRMPELLDGGAEDSGALLDRLDAELSAQIDRLAAQRELIARLRQSGTAPDLPPELGPFLAATAGSSELARFDREQTVLLAHFAGAAGLPRIAQFYERLNDPALSVDVATVNERFGRLGPESSEGEARALVDDFTALLAPMLLDLVASEPMSEIDGAAGLFDEYARDVLNEQQRRTVEALEARLTALLEG